MFCTRIDKPWINDKESGYLWSYYSADTQHWSQILMQHFSYSTAFVFESGITTCFWILNSMLLWDIPQTLWIYCGHLCSWIYIAFLFEYFLSLIFKARVTQFHISIGIFWNSNLKVRITQCKYFGKYSEFKRRIFSFNCNFLRRRHSTNNAEGVFLHGKFNGCLFFSHLDKIKNLFWTGGQKLQGV